MLESLNTNNLEYQKLTKDEMTKRGILGRLVGACADIINPTRNGRKYSEKLWENVFDDPIMKERIENGVCYGELGHPADREETDMEKIAVCLAEVPKKGSDGKLRAVFDILNTPNGRILKSLCDYGSTLGISSRGSGDLEVDFDGQESVNPDTYNCEGFDIVLIPAVKDARLQYVTESLDKKRYNKTLREKLTESINEETEDHQKIMKESLNTLGIDLNESKDAWDSLSTILTEAKLSPEEKMDMWHDGLRRENIKACGDDKLWMYHRICQNKGYNEQVKTIEAELLNRGLIGDDDDNKLQVTMSDDKSELHIYYNEASANLLDFISRHVGADATKSIDFNEETHEYILNRKSPYANEIASVILHELQMNESLDESLFAKSYDNIPLIDKITFRNTQSNGVPGIANIQELIKEFENIGLDKFKVRTTKFGSNISKADIKDEFTYPYRLGWSVYSTIDDSLSGFNEVYIITKKQKNESLEECNSQNNETYINEEDEAGDVDTALIDELQEALKLNKKLDEKIVNLQKQVSASNAKEIELNEEIDNLKIKIVKLSDKAKSNMALTEKLSKLERDLQESTEAVQTKKTALRETIDRDAKERKTLQESIESKDNEIAELQKQLTEANKKVSVTDKDVKALNEQLDTAHKDARQLKEKYSKKLEEKDILIEKYKKIAKTAVDNYISSKATVLGVSTNEIKNRLPESYSFKDINEVCDSLREYNINMNSLPFTTNKLNEGINVAVKNADTRTLIKNEDDEISDADMKLAEKFMRK